MRTALLGVTGGIAAFKAAELASLLRKRGWETHTVLTRNATRFIAPLTFEGLTHHPAHVDGFAPGPSILHIDLARQADVVAIVPASADFLAKMSCGLADDLLSTVILATTAPVVVAPAMNVEMWRNPATQENVARLRGRGIDVVQPRSGELACGEIGEGKLARIETIYAHMEAAWGRTRQLSGRTIMVTAGGTREPIDPVRYIGNRSSGKMGHALALEAAQRGARVLLVTTAAAPAHPGIQEIQVETAAELATAVLDRLEGLDALIMAAAVADWRPAHPSSSKLKKSTGAPEMVLEPTVDVLAEAGRRRRPELLLVGFAAETDDLLVHARAKLEAKNADLIVANDAASAMEADDNAAVILDRNGVVADLPRQPKTALAAGLWDILASRLSRAPEGQAHDRRGA